MKKIALLMIINLLYLNLYSQEFEKEILLDNYYGREAEFGDFDRDGDLDILMFYTYDDAYGEGYTRILENTENGFIELEVGFPRVEYFGGSRNGAINWVDYNNDGYLDVFLVIGQPFSEETKMFKNNRDKSFTEIPLNINDLVLGSCGPSWADFDNDGDLDLTIFGDADFNDYTIKIYKNDIDNQIFTAIDFDFGNCIIKSRKPWGDFNKDGYIDLLVNTPIDNYQCNIAIFKNNGDNTFTKITFPDLVGLDQDLLNQTGDMSWGDYNNDGYLDILISGRNTSYSGSGITSLYKNNGDETFSEVSIEGVYPTESDVSIEWGDFDNDGDLDILQTGEGDISPTQMFSRTILYINDNGSFQNSEIEFLDVHQCGMSTGADYNGDANLDILVLGEVDYIHHQIAIFNNISENINTKPLPPVNLKTEIVNNDLILSWSAGSDAETNQAALSYNVYLIYENDTIVQPNSLENGIRTIVGVGNAQQNTFYKFKNAPSGNCRWSVQTIDNSFVGSEFALEQTGVTEINNKNYFEIYPNPTTGTLNFEFADNKIQKLTIFDIIGQQIIEKTQIQQNEMIDLSCFESGIYIIKIQTDNKIFITKIVKE